MFAKSIVTSDAFLDMPMSSRCLYFTLGMLADDDGFVNNPKSIMRQVGATNDDFQVLLAKKFIIVFESGVIVIKHWRMNNYLRSDRYSATKYIDEKAELDVDTDGIYHKRDNDGIPAVYQTVTQDRLGKDSIGKVNKKESVKEKSEEEVEKIPPRKTASRFTPPTYEEVFNYCAERQNTVNAQRFIDFYTSNGWKVGRNAMKDWKAAVRYWEKDEAPQPKEDPKMEELRRIAAEYDALEG